MGVCRACWSRLSGYAWHASTPGDVHGGQVTGPYCYGCVPKTRAPWRHRIPRDTDALMSRLEEESRRFLGRRFSWVKLVDEPDTGDRRLQIRGLPQRGQATPAVDLLADGETITFIYERPSGGVDEFAIPAATEPALVVAQASVLVAPSGTGEQSTAVAR
ncbi:MAG: hypothetical protein KGP12_09790 [Actinomycetales bacterium]|nr:hypothetical protein [Actinomycetales bacterium]